jgi:hypothetical protein
MRQGSSGLLARIRKLKEAEDKVCGSNEKETRRTERKSSFIFTSDID